MSAGNEYLSINCCLLWCNLVSKSLNAAVFLLQCVLSTATACIEKSTSYTLQFLNLFVRSSTGMCLLFVQNLLNVTWTISSSIFTSHWYCLCPPGNLAKKSFFPPIVVGLFSQNRKKTVSLQTHYHSLLHSLHSFLMVDLKPANPWRKRSLQEHEKQLVFLCLWQLGVSQCFVCICVRTHDSSLWPLYRI